MTADITYRANTIRDLDRLLDRGGFDADTKLRTRAVATVLPFRTNTYVTDELIDWDRAPDDPLFRLVFPQPDMLGPDELATMTALLRDGADRKRTEAAAREIRRRMNPHPAGQTDLNVPTPDGRPLAGVQHKYRETLLFFPRRGQTCHAYCTYCFRWAQFVGESDLKIATDDVAAVTGYLRDHTEITDVLITGGDPLIMSTDNLRQYIEPLLAPDLAHVRTIRLGTKALAYWPYRVTTGPDADDLCRLFEQVVAAGRHLAVMGHFTHPNELRAPEARAAVRRVVGTGAVVRTQAPLVRGINDDADDWAELWREAVALGAVPYYMFVERDTGPRRYFEVPLHRAWQIFRDATRQVSGLARTARGPSMSAVLGKVAIDGVATVAGEDVFCLRYLQARDPSWVGRPFFAKHDPTAAWMSDLVPALGSEPAYFDN
ncbi:KamA family radical SAM protein [Actinophytocola sp. NPDC049390]|uniref:KamA family radical SAM protein n=1 Tax=Actinophytocola sp. NPDC049390 TaxID=3363894 RepID=UPI00379F75C6